MRTHAQLVEAAYKWVLRETRCRVAFKEVKTVHPASGEQPDVIAFGAYGMSIVIECKASRADFLADAKKPFRVNPETGMGLQRYYCCPSEMIKKDELPRLWGLIYVPGDIRSAWCAYDPDDADIGLVKRRFVRNIDAEMAVMYSALAKNSYSDRLKGIDADATTSDTWTKASDEWQKKDRPNQVYGIVRFNSAVVTIRSNKTGMDETMPRAKFMRLFEPVVGEI